MKGNEMSSPILYIPSSYLCGKCFGLMGVLIKDRVPYIRCLTADCPQFNYSVPISTCVAQGELETVPVPAESGKMR
jgi:hypothetical protein